MTEEVSANEIGELAGHIWNYLYLNGKTPALKLRLENGATNSAFFLATGWLARESKITIEKENGEYIFSLVK